MKRLLHQHMPRIESWQHKCIIPALITIVLFLVSIPWAVRITPVNPFRITLSGGRASIFWDRRPHVLARTSEFFYVYRNLDGVQWMSDGQIYSDGRWFVRIPLWMPLLVCLAPIVAVRIYRHWSVPPGCCRHCRYDLRGSQVDTNSSSTTHALTCPECGTRQSPPADR